MPNGCTEVSASPERHIALAQESRRGQSRHRRHRRRRRQSPVQFANRTCDSVKQIACLGVQQPQHALRREVPSFSVVESSRCTMLASRCLGCGRRLGLISGLRGFGLLQSRHEALCTDQQKQSDKLREGRPKVRTSKVSTDEVKGLLPRTIQIAQREVPITARDIELDVMTKVVEARQLHEWANSVASEKRFEVSSIHIQSVDLFGLFGPKAGIIKCVVDARVRDQQLSSIVVMRRSAVAVLMVLQHYNVKFTVLVRRPRVPVGLSDMAEIPAGTIDENGKLAGVVAEEMDDRARMDISVEEMIDMSFLAYGNRYPGVFPSPHALHEHRSIYLYQRNVTSSELEKLRANLCDQHEGNIRFEIVPLETLWRRSPDAKALAASCLYQKLTETGGLPKLPYFDDDAASWDIGSSIQSVGSSLASSFASAIGLTRMTGFL